MQELRCENGILFAVLDDGVVKVKCRSHRCGAGVGKVVIHRFDAGSGILLDTRRYKDPATRKGGGHGVS
jgi:hypothetical protein